MLFRPRHYKASTYTWRGEGVTERLWKENREDSSSRGRHQNWKLEVKRSWQTMTRSRCNDSWRKPYGMLCPPQTKRHTSQNGICHLFKRWPGNHLTLVQTKLETCYSDESRTKVNLQTILEPIPFSPLIKTTYLHFRGSDRLASPRCPFGVGGPAN